MKFHPLSLLAGGHSLPSPPERFNNPFDYEPHPLCQLAVKGLCMYIESHLQYNDELHSGKMFGVLVVRYKDELGYLAAYSGQLQGCKELDYFVPNVFDYLQPDGYFKCHEAEISEINRQIASIETTPERIHLLDEIQQAQIDAVTEIDAYKEVMTQAKRQRDFSRQTGDDARTEDELIRESQFMKAELVRIKQKWRNIQKELDTSIAHYDKQIDELKGKRQQKSEALQTWLFQNFIVRNARGETRDLLDIFKYTPMGMPPSGSGECCAPKLLQYAFSHDMQPLCIAEFWWGESPKSVIRRHLNYYNACRGKCLPILTFMLEGMDVEQKEMHKDAGESISILYEDESIVVVYKPSGLLSVPGKSERHSVFSILSERGYTPKTVHRLDMDTSGILVVPRTTEAHHSLQRQFYNRTVKKRYVAIVEPMIGITLNEGDHGIIDIPICPDPFDRPRQMVDYDYGKRSITEWRVVSPQPSGLGSGEVVLSLVPHTGRTHQLRVHCASCDGLASPIKGDPLYGHRGERLCLHAEYLEFAHPVTGKRLHFKVEADF